MRAVTLPVFLLCLCLCHPYKGVGAYEVLMWLHAECGCSYSVHEQSGFLEVCAEIMFICDTATTNTTYNVTISTVEDSATSGVDYDPLSSFVLSFAEGSSQGDQQCTTISITDDIAVESTESFRVELSTSDPQVAFSAICPSAPVRITDSDVIIVEVIEQSMAIDRAESLGGAVEICLNFTHGLLERSVFCSYYTRSGSADSQDYRSVSSRVSFFSGMSVGDTRCVSVSIFEDTRVENESEHFFVDFGSGSGITVNPSARSARITIHDDDGAVIGMASPTLSLTEHSVDIHVCVALLQSQRLEITFTAFIKTQAITATGGSDYNEISNASILFRYGDVLGAQRCATININNDAILEYSETFEVILSENSARLEIESGRETTEITILEDDDGVTIGLQETSYVTTEAAGPFSVCAQMFAGNLEREVSMTLVSSDGTAVAPGDYEVLNTQVVFGVGASNGTVACADLHVVDDNVVEVDEETITLTMSADDPSVTTTTALAATVTIRENGNDVASSISLNSTNYDALESNGGVDVCVVITATALDRNLTVFLSSQDGTATNGADYSSFQFEPFTFFSGAQFGDELCYSIPVVDDNFLEDSESFLVTLSSFEPTFLGNNLTQAVVTIVPDPADTVGLAFQSNAYSGTEQPSLRDVTICVEITMGILERDVVVNVTTTSGTAESGIDYTGPTPSELTFRGGLSTGDERCIVVSVVDDNFIEDEETFDISLTVPPADAASVIFNGADVTTFTIIQDPNDRATVQLQRERVSGMEGQNISVCVVLLNISGEVRRSLVIDVRVTSAIADIGMDFDVRGPAAVTFPPNSISGDIECITIELLTDRFLEIPENFVTNLNTIDPAVTVDLTADLTIITIIDVPDPNAVGVTFTSLDFNVTEGDQFVEVCVEIVIGTVNEEDTVQVETVSGTATADSDFTSLIGSVRFFPGETVGAFGCVPIGIFNDDIVEDDETFAVSLTSVGTLQAIGNTTANVTIFQDSDFVVLGLQTPALTVMESETFSVCVIITGGSLEIDISIGLEAENSSSAEAGIDFIGPDPSILIFTAGQSEGDIQCAEVSILDDSVLDGERNFSIRLVETTGEDGINSDGRPGRAEIDDNSPSTNIHIDLDFEDVIIVQLSQPMYQVTEGPLLGPSAELTVCVTIDSGSLGRDVSVNLVTPITGSFVIATPLFDFIPIAETLIFTEGQSMGDSVCTQIMILSDFFVETEETFEILLLPDLENLLTANILPGMDRAIVTILDSQEDNKILVQPSVSNLVSTEGDDGNGGDSVVEVCIELASENLQRSVTVNVRTISSLTATATVNEDYLDIDMTLTFIFGPNTTGNNQECVFIPLLNDNILEGNETFDILITPTAEDEDLLNITNPVITVTIEEDNSDFVEVGLLPQRITITENDTFSICVELTNGVLERDVTIPLVVESGSAVEGSDFIGPNPPALTLMAGQSAGAIQCATVTILDDSIPQGERNFSISIGSRGGNGGGGGVRVSPDLPSTEVNIAVDPNDVIFVRLSQLMYRLTEGLLMGPLAMATVCATIDDGFAGRSITVNLVTTATTGTRTIATPIFDFIPIVETLTFIEGQSVGDSVCAEIMIVSDIFVEAEETFEVLLLPDPEDLFSAVIIPGMDRATVTIMDGEEYNSVEVRPISSTVTAKEGVAPAGDLRRRSVEGGDDCAEVMVCLELVNGNLQRNVSVTVQTVSSPTSTATVNVDYVSVERNVTFTSGQNATGDNQQCIFISLLDDDVLEGNQTFNVLITAAPGNEDVVIISSTDEMITVIIQEDPNDNIQIGLTNTRFTLTEAVDSSILLCAELQVGSLERNISVAVVTEGSNATAGVDFLIEPEVLTFTSGQSAFDGLVQCTTITILDDEDTEPRENLMVFLEPTEGDSAAVIMPRSSFMSLISILEDPSDEVQISPLALVQTVTEGGTATVCIGVSLGSLQTSVQVNVRTMTSVASTATPGEDFSVLMETVTVNSNEPVCNTISILDDDILEGCEAFFIDIEVQTAFSGIAVVPDDVDKMIVLIEEDLVDEIVVGLSQSVFMAFEVNGFVTVCIELLEGRLERNVSVPIETVEGAAAPNDDYIPLFDEFFIASGAQPGTLTCVNITIIDENVVESPESFSVVIFQTRLGVRIDPSRATSMVEIIDEEYDVAASTDSKEVAVAVSVAVIILVAIVIAVIVCAYYKLKHRQNKIAAYTDEVALKNVQALGNKEIPVKLGETAAW